MKQKIVFANGFTEHQEAAAALYLKDKEPFELDETEAARLLAVEINKPKITDGALEFKSVHVFKKYVEPEKSAETKETKPEATAKSKQENK